MYKITFGNADPIECTYLLTAIYILLGNYMAGPDEPMVMEYVPESEEVEGSVPDLSRFDTQVGG